MCIITKAMRIEKGMVKDAIRELRRFHIKKIITNMIRMAPINMDSST
jgi:hypothetical protein